MLWLQFVFDCWGIIVFDFRPQTPAHLLTLYQLYPSLVRLTLYSQLNQRRNAFIAISVPKARLPHAAFTVFIFKRISSFCFLSPSLSTPKRSLIRFSDSSIVEYHQHPIRTLFYTFLPSHTYLPASRILTCVYSFSGGVRSLPSFSFWMPYSRHASSTFSSLPRLGFTAAKTFQSLDAHYKLPNDHAICHLRRLVVLLQHTDAPSSAFPATYCNTLTASELSSGSNSPSGWWPHRLGLHITSFQVLKRS